METSKRILLDHGSGGKLTLKLIDSIFIKHFNNNELSLKKDAASLKAIENDISFTTDSFVINPIFFPGGDIGKLAVCGTVNDLAVSGAKPLYLSCGFIIEEGLLIPELENIVISMAKAASDCGVSIVTGDTKVVEKGACDKIFINTSGIGVMNNNYKETGTGTTVEPGDKIVINGFIADHEIAIMNKRNDYNFHTTVKSDCAALNGLIQNAINKNFNIKFMRDATRGGLATVLCELVNMGNFGINVNESDVPVREEVAGICELLGFDPLYMANEGKAIFVVGKDDADKLISEMRNDALGTESKIIGEVTSDHIGIVTLKTKVGGTRIIDTLTGGQLPRIC